MTGVNAHYVFTDKSGKQTKTSKDNAENIVVRLGFDNPDIGRQAYQYLRYLTPLCGWRDYKYCLKPIHKYIGSNSKTVIETMLSAMHRGQTTSDGGPLIVSAMLWADAQEHNTYVKIRLLGYIFIEGFSPVEQLVSFLVHENIIKMYSDTICQQLNEIEQNTYYTVHTGERPIKVKIKYVVADHCCM